MYVLAAGVVAGTFRLVTGAAGATAAGRTAFTVPNKFPVENGYRPVRSTKPKFCWIYIMT